MAILRPDSTTLNKTKQLKDATKDFIYLPVQNYIIKLAWAPCAQLYIGNEKQHPQTRWAVWVSPDSTTLNKAKESKAANRFYIYKVI